MIPINECKRGSLYRLNARNITIGVYVEQPRPGFIGIRNKLTVRYLALEHHRDADTHFGTAAPLDELEVCPVGDLRTDLDLKCVKCGMAMRKEGKPGNIHNIHIDPTECTEQWGVLGFNRPLFDYLNEALKRFGCPYITGSAEDD